MSKNKHSLLESSNVSLPTLDEIKQITSTKEADRLLHRIRHLLQLHIDDDDMLVKLKDIQRAVLHRHMINHLNRSVRVRNANQQQSN